MVTMELRTNTNAHTHSHTHTLLCVNYFFFLSILLLWFAHFFCEYVCVKLCVRLFRLTYGTTIFLTFIVHEEYSKKKLGILISSAKYWTPGTINSQTLAHTFFAWLSQLAQHPTRFSLSTRCQLHLAPPHYCFGELSAKPPLETLCFLPSFHPSVH
uniref:(northern house mosquito) hypothetical protein n=1 Tax=Culex pipiens TaxID=7175 RepID=A0A8D8B2E7_CULPI